MVSPSRLATLGRERQGKNRKVCRGVEFASPGSISSRVCVQKRSQAARWHHTRCVPYVTVALPFYLRMECRELFGLRHPPLPEDGECWELVGLRHRDGVGDDDLLEDPGGEALDRRGREDGV